MITVLGASGFIGSHLARRLDTLGVEHQSVGRKDSIPSGNLGDVIYCVGVTADFRSRLFDTVEAHVCSLLELLRTREFDSLLYLSSTRLYGECGSTDEETILSVNPGEAEDLYNISKAMGESLVLNCTRTARVARISNVYGPDFNSDNFLATILRQAAGGESIIFETAPDSAKDYVSLTDVLDGLMHIARDGRERIYNLAGGTNVSHGELAQRLRDLTNCSVEFATGAAAIKYPRINIDRMRREFGFTPASVLDDLPHLVELYKGNRSRNDPD